MSPLEDTIVALRPIIPELPWELPNAIRNLSPMMPTGSTQFFNNIDPQGNPTAPIVNQLVNFGWEYVYHCHILTHEEMDMMRPVSVAMPPVKPDGLALQPVQHKGTLTWNDNSIAETSYVVQRSTERHNLDRSGEHRFAAVPAEHPRAALWVVGPLPFGATTTYYRVIARNPVGSLAAGFSTVRADSISNVLAVHSIVSGWNLITQALADMCRRTAEMVLTHHRRHGAATELDRWTSGAWTRTLRTCRHSTISCCGPEDFLKSSGTGAWPEAGTPFTSPVTLNLVTGWNLVGVPFQPTPLTAEALLTGITAQGGNCSEVDRWSNGGWNAHFKTCRTSNNFTIQKTWATS